MTLTCHRVRNQDPSQRGYNQMRHPQEAENRGNGLFLKFEKSFYLGMLVPDPRLTTDSLRKYLSLYHVPGTILCTVLGWWRGQAARSLLSAGSNARVWCGERQRINKQESKQRDKINSERWKIIVNKTEHHGGKWPGKGRTLEPGQFRYSEQGRLLEGGSIWAEIQRMRSRQTWEDVTSKLSRQKEQKVPIPQGRNMLGMFQGQKEERTWCGQMNKGESGRGGRQVPAHLRGCGKGFGFHSASTGSP